ncbi:pyridoxamine 5'-phosphate oxidase family protein [Streptomyces sp. NBC_01363]|uniref:pyridoxamine 5'-phosphate oxidase family protein n=1 Tax=Streptomyces sp. NBC_01363 TaxID=2903840 RepID=UPI002259CCE0|nr:pyridoxamine 5'-phosphate oxidase family protein [Streptomyces sp. NBC_01363]MCX4730975.1 pyridoxamine 5'-phosphate oxidase family protein [Streptomyces sp. NBC_01363]
MSSEELQAIELLGRVRYGRLATSMRALPFLSVARHVVIDGRVVLRMHSGFGYHNACDGTVVAYGADNFDAAGPGVDGPGVDGDLWAVQFTGTAEIVHPAPGQRRLFGDGPARVNGEPFDPAYLRIEPHFVSVHTLGFDASQPIRPHSVI